MKKINGIIICFLLAIIAWYLGKSVPLIGASIFGLLLGIVAGIVLRYKNQYEGYKLGVTYTQKKLLKLAIVLLGFQMNFSYVIAVGNTSLLVMGATIVTSLLVAYFLGRGMKIASNTGILIGVGTSICGGSAIMATAPVIDAHDDEVTHAISTIFLFNIIGALTFPIMGSIFGMTDVGFGLWAGTAINDTSSVVAAASQWSQSHGNDIALTYATIVKLTRTLMIVPITLCLALWRVIKAKSETKNAVTYKMSKIFPWFVLYFLGVVILNSVFDLPLMLTKSLTSLGKFMIAMAMVSVGMSVDIRYMIKQGIRPLLLGLACSISVASVALLVQYVIGIW